MSMVSATSSVPPCKSKTVRAATAMPSTVGQRCFSTSAHRRGGCVCSILPALLLPAFTYTPWGYLHHRSFYTTCQGSDYPSDVTHETPRRRILRNWMAEVRKATGGVAWPYYCLPNPYHPPTRPFAKTRSDGARYGTVAKMFVSRAKGEHAGRACPWQGGFDDQGDLRHEHVLGRVRERCERPA